MKMYDAEIVMTATSSDGPPFKCSLVERRKSAVQVFREVVEDTRIAAAKDLFNAICRQVAATGYNNHRG